MAPPIITSPTAAAALGSVDLLHQLGDAVATRSRRGTRGDETHLQHEPLLPSRWGS